MSTPNTASRSGLPPGVEPAPLGGRFVAYLIDHALPAVLVAVASGIAVGTQLNGRGRTVLLVVTLLVSLLWGLLVWRMYALRAAGPGMRVTKLQLVGYRDGRPIGWGRFLLRWFVLALLTATGIGLVIMVVSMVRQVRLQGWHDLAAESVVIKQRMLAPPRAVPAASPVSPESPAEDEEDEEFEAEPAEELATGQPEPAAPVVGDAAPVPATVSSGWSITFDDGSELPVDGLVLVGRNPVPEPGEEDSIAIKVADETRTVSKTHLAVGVDENGLYVMDRGSTNGSTVTTAEGGSSRAGQGDVVPVEDGSIVSFGDHWFRVARH